MAAFSPFPSRRSLALAFALAAAATATSCKKESPASSAPDAFLDDIDAIEAELANNASELEAQGILVARADAPTAGAAQTATPSQDSLTLSDDADLGGDASDEPAGEEQVAPDPSPAPTAVRKERERLESRADRRYARKEAQTRCERICDLAEATCDLADRVCGLAQRHIDDVRYENACERAAEYCRVASTACTNCAD